MRATARSARAPETRLGLGPRGEAAAAAFLQGRGYRILTQNYRCRLGEVDLVALDRGCVVFIEVKTRRHTRTGSGSEAITATKQRRLRRLALHYLAAMGLEGTPCRFDVVALLVRGERARISLLRDAFQGMRSP